MTTRTAARLRSPVRNVASSRGARHVSTRARARAAGRVVARPDGWMDDWAVFSPTRASRRCLVLDRDWVQVDES